MDMPIHLGFRDKLKLGAAVLKLGILGQKTLYVRRHYSPAEVHKTVMRIKSDRVTSFYGYHSLHPAVNARQNQFSPAGFAEVQQLLGVLQGAFSLNNGMQVHMIVHNSNLNKMKRIEVELPGGVFETMWTDS
jgi:hypothetical protein